MALLKAERFRRVLGVVPGEVLGTAIRLLCAAEILMW